MRPLRFLFAKDSSRAQLLEAKHNLQRMLAQILLTDDERYAVEDGAAAVERLIARLADVPTPGGLTPRKLMQSTNLRSAQTLLPVERRQLLTAAVDDHRSASLVDDGLAAC
jgi:hypothetical protein